MKREYKVLIIFCCLLLSCLTTKEKKETEVLGTNQHIYWINSTKAPCVGVAPMDCMQVQKGEKININKWELFYDNIEGFDYKSGYVYKIIVEETKLPENEVPADASSIRYKLVKVLSRESNK